MANETLEYICTTCGKDVKSTSFVNLISCPFCSSKIFVKKPKKNKKTIECI